MDNSLMVSTYDFFPEIIAILENGHKAKFTISGTSMLPWIRDNLDQVVLSGVKGKKISPGDIVLFYREDKGYTLHRIYKKEKNWYITIGDSCLIGDGLIQTDHILGIVETIYRKGKRIPCSSKKWKFIFWLWRKLLPVRPHLMRLYYTLVRVKKKLTMSN